MIWHDTDTFGSIVSSRYFPLNTWVFLTVVFTNTQVIFYANGVNTIVITFNYAWGANFPTASMFVIGGYYDDLSIFPYALNASQVNTLCRSGFPGICTCPPGTYQNGTQCRNGCSYYNNLGTCILCPANSYCLLNSAAPIL